MARADYEEQLRRYAGKWDVLPHGLPVPTVSSADADGRMARGVIELTEDVLAGNRWPAVSGALLAEAACRCATVAALARTPTPVLREIAVRFRKAIPVADARTRPHVGDGVTSLSWSAAVDDAAEGMSVGVEMARRLPSAPEPVVTVEARARFDAAPTGAGDPFEAGHRIESYLASLPRRLALPAYELGWTDTEVRGVCREAPGSLVGAAEQALGDAGKIVRGLGVPDDHDESMLLADMTYRFVEPVHDALATYVSRVGERRKDEKGRTWLAVSATLSLDGRTVGEAAGTVVFRSMPRRA